MSFFPYFLLIMSFILRLSCLERNIDKSLYLKAREKLISEDLSYMLGNDVTLSRKEEAVNSVLMDLKEQEILDHFQSGSFPPAESFLTAKYSFEASKLYPIIKQMPKGAALHIHDKAIAPPEWIVSELTYWDDLYMCTTLEGKTMFRFFEEPDDTCLWKTVNDARNEHSSVREFDQMLVKKFSFGEEVKDYGSFEMWKHFGNVFSALNGVVLYRPAFERYIQRGLEEYMNDNITYIEFRSSVKPLYLKNGKKLTVFETAEIYKKICDDFTAKNRDRFSGVRIIYSKSKRGDSDAVWAAADEFLGLRSNFSDFVIGFDLVSHEDTTNSLHSLVDPLLFLATQKPPTKFFFHAGETNWHGLRTDENLFDAILLNVTRIGHAYAISKHPLLRNMVKESKIPLEVCPISSQVLKYVDDLRNHPMVAAFVENYPIVISSDDNAIWGADPLSHDLYAAFMAMGGAKADLRFLKKLAMNSIEYSALEDNEKARIMRKWNIQWDKFIYSAHKAMDLSAHVPEPVAIKPPSLAVASTATSVPSFSFFLLLSSLFLVKKYLSF